MLLLVIPAKAGLSTDECLVIQRLCFSAMQGIVTEVTGFLLAQE
jgi:hypothetical protein